MKFKKSSFPQLYLFIVQIVAEPFVRFAILAIIFSYLLQRCGNSKYRRVQLCIYQNGFSQRGGYLNKYFLQTRPYKTRNTFSKLPDIEIFPGRDMVPTTSDRNAKLFSMDNFYVYVRTCDIYCIYSFCIFFFVFFFAFLTVLSLQLLL